MNAISDKSYARIVTWLSLPLASLVAISSYFGIFVADFYSAETLNWQIQAQVQDVVDLVLIVPLLVVLALLTFVNRKTSATLWAGILLYLVYTFAIYCFDIHFNRLFLIYSLVLGLSFFSFIYFFHSEIKRPSHRVCTSPRAIQVIGIYFISISSLFYLLWLAEVTPAIAGGTIPKSTLDAGLVTNPVHVLDLSIVLPGIFITGILLLKKNYIGFILTPVILVFFVLMDITIGSLTVAMTHDGLGGSFILAAVMGVLAAASLYLLVWYLRNWS